MHDDTIHTNENQDQTKMTMFNVGARFSRMLGLITKAYPITSHPKIKEDQDIRACPFLSFKTLFIQDFFIVSL